MSGVVENRGPAPRFLWPVTSLAARMYLGVITKRNAAFDEGRRVVSIDRPVISVGNLTVGGVGKTPIVTSIIDTLRTAGHDPAIAMRGYKAAAGHSDEADAYARRFNDLPMVVQPRRVDGLIDLFALERGARVDAVVLDDGFQHRGLARQFDIVAIDAAAKPGVFDDSPLPLGWLREPVASLARADAVVFTHADRTDATALGLLRKKCLEQSDRLLIAEAAHEWTGFDVAGPGSEADRSMLATELRGREVVVVCAIGKPDRFITQVESNGLRVVDRMVLRDHDSYGPGALRRLRRVAARAGTPVVTTDKDWSKLRRTGLSREVEVIRPRLSIKWLRGGDALLDRVLRVVASFQEEARDERA